MTSGWPAATMPLPGVVFSTSVPVWLWVVMAVAKVEAALELEVISCRMEPCGTMVVAEVEDGAEEEAGDAVEAGTGAATGTTGMKNKKIVNII